MAITVASLVARVKADTSGAASDLGKFGGILGKTAGSIAVVGIAVAAMAVGAGVAAAKMAGDFQQGITLLKTGAGEAQANLKMVGDGIQQIAVNTGTSTKDLLAAMFHIESENYRGADSLKVLTAAAEGARIGQADLVQMANVLAVTLHDYGLAADSATGVTNLLIQSVKDGNMTMDDLNQAITKVLPVAHALRVPIEDVSGALSTMASWGDKGAEAGTHLSMMFKMLANPTGAARKEMAAMGVDSIKLAQTMQTSLPDALKMIQDAVAQHFTPGSVEYNRAVMAILGGAKSGTAGLEIMGASMNLLVSNTNDMADALHKGGNSVNGWADVQKNFNFQIAKGKEVIEVLGIKLGTFLLPIFMNLMSVVGSDVMPIITAFENALDPVQQTVTTVGLSLSGLGASLAKLTPPFDEGERAIGKLVNVAKPIPPMFDEAANAVHKVVNVAKPLPPMFDEGSRAVAKLTASTKAAHPPLDTLGNILKGVANFITSDVLPTVQQLATFFTKDMVPALDKVWGDFQKDVLPTVGKFSAFVRTDVLPVVEKLALWFMTKVVPAAMQVVKWFGDDILPVLKQVWQVVATQVIPVVQGIAENVMDNLVPAIEHLISKLAPVLIPIFHQVGDVLKNQVGPTLNTVIGFVTGLINVITTIISKIGDFLGLLGQVKDKIAGAFSGLNNIPIIGGLLPHFAQGGTMGADGYAVVGEQGPELVKLPAGAHVFSNLQSAQQTAPSLNTSPVLASQQRQANEMQTMHFILQLDTRTIAEKVFAYGTGTVRARAGLRGA